jgi:hypothetical protein
MISLLAVRVGSAEVDIHLIFNAGAVVTDADIRFVHNNLFTTKCTQKRYGKKIRKTKESVRTQFFGACARVRRPARMFGMSNAYGSCGWVGGWVDGWVGGVEGSGGMK